MQDTLYCDNLNRAYQKRWLHESAVIKWTVMTEFKPHNALGASCVSSEFISFKI